MKRKFEKFIIDEIYTDYGEYIYTIIGFGSFFEEKKDFGDIDLAIILEPNAPPFIKKIIFEKIKILEQSINILISTNIIDIYELLDLLFKYQDIVALRAIYTGKALVNDKKANYLKILIEKFLSYELITIPPLTYDYLQAELLDIENKLFHLEIGLQEIVPKLVSLTYKIIEYKSASENIEVLKDLIKEKDFKSKLLNLIQNYEIPIDVLLQNKYKPQNINLDFLKKYLNLLKDLVKTSS